MARRETPPEEFSETEMAGFRATAAPAIGVLTVRQSNLLRELVDRPGSRVIIEAPEGAAPLSIALRPAGPFPTGAGGGRVAHGHFLTVGVPGGSAALSNEGFARGPYWAAVALRDSAGRHPVGDGFCRLAFVGIECAPEVAGDGTVVIRAQGLVAELPEAEVRVDGETIQVRVGG